MATLLEMAKEIIVAHVSKTEMNKEELLTELTDVHNVLSKLQKEEEVPSSASEQEVSSGEESSAPQLSLKRAFRKDKVICLICGKEMKTLSRHLKSVHGMSQAEYRKKFDIPRTQALAARNYSESRRQMAIERGLGENLAKARAARSKASK